MAQPPDEGLNDIAGEPLVGGMELLPPRPSVTAFTAREVGGEVFNVDLVSRAVSGYPLEGQAADLDDEDGLVDVGGERRLDDAVRFVRGRSQDEQPVRRLAHFDAAGALPTAGEVACAELTALAQIAFHLAEPAGEAARIGEG